MGEKKCSKRLEVSGAVLALVDEGSKVLALHDVEEIQMKELRNHTKHPVGLILILLLP